MQPYEILELEFAKWAGVENTVAVSSGTSALHLAFEALELPLGSQVLVPEFCMVACPRAVVMAGLKPVFVDCGEDLNIDPSLLADALRAETTAILAVHTYGRQCNMPRIAEFARLHGLAVVEDLAEAHEVPVHSATTAATWSFFKNKQIAGEEGGMIAFADPNHAKLAKMLRCQGFTDAHDFHHIPRGVNARLSNANAQLILDSLDQVYENLIRRRQVEEWYIERTPTGNRMPTRNSVWVYDLRFHGMTSEHQDHLVRTLNKKGVAARHAFKCCSSQPEFRGEYKHLLAYRMSREVIYLPVHPEMTEEPVDRNMSILLACLRS